MPNPLDHLYDELKVKYPDFVDRGEFVSKLSNEDELKKLHQAATQSFKGFVGFDDFKNKVGESLSTYDQDSDYKTQNTASTGQENAETGNTTRQQEESRPAPSEPQNSGIESEASVPDGPTATSADAEAFDRETGDLDELGRRYDDKVKRLKGYGVTEGLYANEEAARKHYEAYSRLLDEAEQDRLVYNRRVKAADREREEAERKEDLKSADDAKRLSAEYAGFTDKQYNEEVRRLNKEKDYLNSKQSQGDPRRGERIRSYNASITALAKEGDKRKAKAEAMDKRVKAVTSSPNVQKRYTSTDTLAYLFSGASPAALRNNRTALERAKTMTPEELIQGMETIASQDNPRGINPRVDAMLAGTFNAYLSQLSYLWGGDKPKDPTWARYDMMSRAMGDTQEDDNFITGVFNYLNGNEGYATAGYQTNPEERANIPQMAITDKFWELVEQEKSTQLERAGKTQMNGTLGDEIMKAQAMPGYSDPYAQAVVLDNQAEMLAQFNIDYDALLQKAIDSFGDQRIMEYAVSRAYVYDKTEDKSLNEVYQDIYDNTIGKVIGQYEPKNGYDFFMRQVWNTNIFSKIFQLGVRAKSGTLGKTDDYAAVTAALERYAQDHQALTLGATAFNFVVTEAPFFIATGGLSSMATQTAERALFGPAVKALSSSLWYRMGRGALASSLTGLQYGFVTDAVDRGLNEGTFDFAKTLSASLRYGRDFAVMGAGGELFGVTNNMILRSAKDGRLNRLGATTLHFMNNAGKTLANATAATGMYAFIDKPALERENKRIEAENKKISEENKSLPKDKQKPLKPLNEVAGVKDMFWSNIAMFASLDAVHALRGMWGVARGKYDENMHNSGIHFDKYDREALKKVFGKNPNSLLRQIVFGQIDGVPAKWFEIDPEAEQEIYQELGRELTPEEKEAYATYGFTELRKVILDDRIPWVTRAKIVTAVTGRPVGMPPVMDADLTTVMGDDGHLKSVVVRSYDAAGTLIETREFSAKQAEKATSVYESLRSSAWRNNALLSGRLVLDAIEDKTYADTVDEMAREKGISSEQFEQMVFGIKQKDITGEKVTDRERQLVEEFDKRHIEKYDAEVKLTGPDALIEQVAREVYGEKWKAALKSVTGKRWSSMTPEDKEFIERYTDRLGRMGIAERTKMLASRPGWVRAVKEMEESVKRNREEPEVQVDESREEETPKKDSVAVEAPTRDEEEVQEDKVSEEEEPVKRESQEEPAKPAIEDEKVSVETPVEERVEPVPEVIELEEEKPAEPEPAKEDAPAEERLDAVRRTMKERGFHVNEYDDATLDYLEKILASDEIIPEQYKPIVREYIDARREVERSKGAPAEEKPATVKPEQPATEGQPQAGTIGFEPVEQPTERERFDAERKEKAATITDADIEANREALGIPEGTALTDEARQIYAEDLAEDLMRYERFKRGESDEKARFHDYWESKFNPKRPKLEKPIEKQEEPVAPPVSDDEEQNEFAVREDEVAPFSLLSLAYSHEERKDGTLKSRFKARRQMETIGKMLGYKVQWVVDKPYNAMIDTEGKALYINLRTDQPLAAVMGHEITHDLRKSDPKAYEALKRYAKDLLGQAQWDREVTDTKDFYGREYKRLGRNPFSEEKAEEEVVCDTMGKVLHTRKGLRELAGSLDPGISGKVYRLLKDIVDKVKSALGKEHDYSTIDLALREFLNAVKQRAKKQLNSQTTDETVHPIQGLDGYTEQDVLDGVRGDIEAKLEDAGVDGVTIKGMALHGSRMRGDARADSDLDVVVEYEGNISEDGLFNILNGEPMYFDGVKVDINPITRGKSGTLEQYMERSHRYDEEKLRDESSQSGTNFSLKRDGRDEDKVPTFYSNAAKAVENVKQNKATAEQWKAMLTKAGGIKAGEDKWMGLSQWLDEHKGKTLTKEEVAQFVADNGIEMKEVNYAELVDEAVDEKLKPFVDEFNEFMDQAEEATGSMFVTDWANWANDQMHEKYGDDYFMAFELVEDRNHYPTIRPLRDVDGELVDAAKYFLGVGEYGDKDLPLDINNTRLDYTTPGLENKREIAFVVPDIEPYQENDKIHFGPENQGRAVMWVRFGEARDADGKRVLVIDEIQSNRHQDAREKGYAKSIPTDVPEISDYERARSEYDTYASSLRQKYGRGDLSYGILEEEKARLDILFDDMFNAEIARNNYLRENNLGNFDEGVPSAPFEKNWHEVAMKRMLRLAAEEGFDKVAWTTGGQQAERYGLGRMYDSIEREDNPSIDGMRFVLSGRNMDTFLVNKEGNIEDSSFSEFNGKPLSDVVGKELAERMMNLEDGDMLEGEDLQIGGEGMKGFYDQMLPRFMDKYGKRWGVKTGEVTLDTPGKEVMHSVDVTPEMRRSVMEQGQPLFSLKREIRTDANGNEVYTETREDGTKDREITTYGDGSKKALWYDDAGVLKERLDYFPNGEVSQVANYDYAGELTRHIQYDENRRITSYYLPAIGTDWKLDENGIARGKSNGVEIRPYNFQFSLKTYHGSGADFDRFDHDYVGSGEGAQAYGWGTYVTEVEGIGRRYAMIDYRRDGSRNHFLYSVEIPDEKEGKYLPYGERVIDPKVRKVLTDRLQQMADEYWNGEIPSYKLTELDKALNTFMPRDIASVLECSDKEVSQLLSKAGYTGVKYVANVFNRNQKGLSYNYVIFNEKDLGITDKEQFSLKRRRNRDDYTDEDRADAAIIANTYLAQADALRQQIEADREQEHRLVEERNKLLAFDYPAADPADRPAIMDRINDLRSQINDLRNANYENNTKLRSMDYEYRVAKEILEQGAVTDEEAARFDAGQMTREEKVLESLFKAAADSRADKKAKQKAIRGLVRELTAITDNFKAAMKARGIESQRKHYDKGTVDHIIRLAKAMMGTGYIDNMTSYEVKRLMGMINNAATRESIETQAGRIVDMMLDHQIRTLRKDFDKQLKVTGQKTNSSGVQVQAGLDQEGQVVMDSYRKSMEIIADSAGKREEKDGELTEWGEFYNKTLNDMGDADPVKAEQARKIFTGVLLAERWFNDVRALEINDRILRSKIEDFKADNKPAKDADADTKQRYNDALADYQEMLRQNKIKIIEAYERITGDVGMTQAESVRRAKEFADEQKQRVEEIQHNANSDLQDVDDNTQVKTPESRIFGANKNNVIVRLLFASAGTYEKFMRFFGRMAPNGEGYLFKRFMTQYHNARQDYWKGRHSAFEEMDKKMAEVFGKKKMHWSDIYEMTRDHKKFPTITVSYWDGYRNGQPFRREDELNQSEALYLYMINKMPDGRMKLRKMGITDDKVQQMAGEIDGRLIQLADWLQSEFLPKMRVKYNETHKRVFGADMAAIEDYFPLRINELAVTSNMDITERDMNDNKPSTITGAIVKRRVNTKPIDLHTDAFDVALSHIDEMEHWAAYAEFNRDNNTLVNYNRFRTKVNNMKSLEFGAGKVLWKNFTNAVAIAADAYHPKAGKWGGDYYSTRVAKFVTTAKISLRKYTALKQLTSIPAFWADSDPLEQFKATVNVVDTWQWAIENLPGFAERWQSRQAGNIKLANYNDLSGLRRRKAMRKLQRAGMWANAAIDGLVCAMGGKAVYETKLKLYRKMGYDEARAQEKALIDAAIAYNNSQQSSEGAYVSPLQVDRTWLDNAFSVFRSASMGYTRRLNTSLRQLRNATFKRGYGAQSVEFLKKQMMRDGLTEEQAEKWAHRIYRRANLKAAASVAIFGQILPFTWNLSANMFYLLFGKDDKEKKKILADSFRHSFFGPIEGLVGGNIYSELGDIAADTAIGKIWGDSIWGDSNAFKTLGYRDFSTMPFSSDINNVLKYFARDEVKAANEVVNILFQVATGVNPQTITDWVTAILDLSRSDMERMDIAMFVMRMLSTPQSQLDKFYLDQMNISQEQASKMSVDDLIKRYATYKRWRETPLTGWMYSDEREKKVEEKFQKRYEEMLEERAVAEEGLRGTINKMTDLPRKRTMMDKLQKELTDSIEATDPELYKKALEGEQAEDDEYVRRVTDKDVELMAELQMKKKALKEAHDRKTKADKDFLAYKISVDEYHKICDEVALDWKLYNMMGTGLSNKINEMKDTMEQSDSELTPEEAMDSIRTLYRDALNWTQDDAKKQLKKDKDKYKKRKKKK